MTDQGSLSTLRAGEIGIVVLQDGTRRDASWHPEDRTFQFCDGWSAGVVTAAVVYEWWPAGVK
jgi:hypothetical protein